MGKTDMGKTGMGKTGVLVLGEPGEAVLGRLSAGLGHGVKLRAGKDAAALTEEADNAKVLFTWGAGRDQVEKVMAAAPGLQWIHARSAGLDKLLSPIIVGSPILLTNGSGVFSQALGEFAILGALY